MQLISSTDGNFKGFNEGASGNLLRYGTVKPPVFDLSKITTVPIAMYVCEEDNLATIVDATKTYNTINTP